MTMNANGSLKIKAHTPSGVSRIENLECLPEAHRAVHQGRVFAPPEPRELPPSQMEALMSSLFAGREERTNELLKRYRPGRTAAENVFAIVKAASISCRATGFAEPDAAAAMMATIEAMLWSGQPVTLGFLSGAIKIQNMLKVPRGIDPDLPDWVMVNQLQALADAIRLATGREAGVVMAADGYLFAGDLGLDPRQADLFLETLQDDGRRWLKAPDVIIASPWEQLDERWYLYLLDEVRTIRLAAKHDPATRSKLSEIAAALVSAVNLRPRGWSYAHTISVFAAVAGHPAEAEAVRDAEDLKRLADQVTHGYVATHHAIRELRLVERTVKHATGHDLLLRCSVHAKPCEPRLALAPSNSLARHYLLPMHSTGRVVTGADGQPRYGPLFDLEGRVGGMQLVGFGDERVGRVRPLCYRPSGDNWEWK